MFGVKEIWPFYACLALNYVAFGLKLLNLVSNCDLAMQWLK